MAAPQDTMQYIWERIPKQKDGITIRYLKADLDYLYVHGFVDSKRYTIEAWKKAFEPFKQKDGSYVLNREQFISLYIYRYFGPANEVFDAKKIRDGSWTDAELKTLYDRSIGVATYIPEEAFWAFIKSFKGNKEYVDEDGNFIINDDVKAGIYLLCERFPSPRRMLEKEVERLREEKQAEFADVQKNRDKSGFSVGETAIETKAAAYQNLKSTTTAPSQTKTKKEAKAKETIDIKKLRKPGGRIKG